MKLITLEDIHKTILVLILFCFAEIWFKKAKFKITAAKMRLLKLSCGIFFQDLIALNLFTTILDCGQTKNVTRKWIRYHKFKIWANCIICTKGFDLI